ncbi:MAG: citryl-CoA lyase [Pseudomonadota bacterium]
MTGNIRGPEFLRERAGHLKSRVGGVVPGSHAVFRGHDLHVELKDTGWIELYVFGITGRRFSPEQLRLMEALWSYTSYPDARIWNNRIAALAGSARSTGTLGVAAALAVSEASIYGHGIGIRTIDFLMRLRRHVDSGGSMEEYCLRELAECRRIGGYGRPLTSADERLVPILSLARELGLGDGPHLRLAFAVEQVLLARRKRLYLNYGGVAAALAADMGFSPREYYLFKFPSFLAGMLPCFIDAAEQPEGALFPLSCNLISYEGKAKRPWRQS